MLVICFKNDGGMGNGAGKEVGGRGKETRLT